MSVAVVILNYNGKALLEKFLPSIIANSPDATIYVADNASTDGSVDSLQTTFPSVKTIVLERNYGFAGGYNRALESVAEDILVLVNSDIEVAPEWLSSPLQMFKSDEKVAIIQPKILDYKRKSHFEYAGAAGGFIDKYGYPFCRGRVMTDIEEDRGQYDDDATIFWASGACFFIRKEVFQQLGEFDEDFFAHQEEIDLCWRAFNLGYKAKFCHNSIVYHVGGATLNASHPRKTYLNFRNSLYMLAKNLPKTRLFPIIFTRLVLDGIAGVRFLISFQPAHCFAIIKAHGSFYANYRKMIGKRGATPKNSDYFRINSVVWEFFVRGRKFFSELI